MVRIYYPYTRTQTPVYAWEQNNIGAPTNEMSCSQEAETRKTILAILKVIKYRK